MSGNTSNDQEKKAVSTDKSFGENSRKRPEGENMFNATFKINIHKSMVMK